jgi:hypothetical protein
MALPYSESTGNKALAMQQIEKTLQKFGCQRLGVMDDFEKGETVIRFEYRDMPIVIRASAKGYAAAWLKENPYSYRSKGTRTDHENRALDKGRKAVYSIIRDWIKGQITAVETGILSFEGAFLGQIMLPTGKTMYEHAVNDGLLPAPENTARLLTAAARL